METNFLSVVLYSVSVDGKEIAIVPAGELENILTCVLHCVDSVNISISINNESISDINRGVLQTSCECSKNNL